MKKVLVVEDDVHLRRVFRTLLENEGFEVLEAADGIEGMAAARAHDPDCIVTDTMMPRLDGLGMLARLASAGEARPTIIVSAVHELPPLDELKAQGVRRVFGKPFPFDQLVAAVVKITGK
jgi:CheY-like chemotaxis protein